MEKSCPFEASTISARLVLFVSWEKSKALFPLLVFLQCMFELIGSEASYLKSLGVALSHFYASKALKRTVSQREHHILFSNIGCVAAASEKSGLALPAVCCSC